MATIEILGWKENAVGFTGWDDRARAELRRRLRRGVKASLHEVRRLARRIDAREFVLLSEVHDEAVYSITQMLETSGANVRVSVDRSHRGQLFRNCPKR